MNQDNKKSSLQKLQMSKKEILFWKIAVILSVIWCAYWTIAKYK